MLLIVKVIKLCTRIAINVKNALDEAYDSNPDALSNRPVLYVIPDESSVMELYEEYLTYEFGGLYFARKDNTSQYQNQYKP